MSLLWNKGKYWGISHVINSLAHIYQKRQVILLDKGGTLEPEGLRVASEGSRKQIKYLEGERRREVVTA